MFACKEALTAVELLAMKLRSLMFLGFLKFSQDKVHAPQCNHSCAPFDLFKSN